MRKTTEIMINELTLSDDINEFINENKDNIETMSLAEYLNELLIKYGYDKSTVFKRAKMSDSTYGYELFRKDTKNPSRDKLIQLCFGFPLTIEKAEKVLRCGKVRPLYPRDERDAYIIFSLNKGYTIDAVNDLLFTNGKKIFE